MRRLGARLPAVLRRGSLAAVAATLVVLAAPAVSALADGDPASDVLPAQNVFLPYAPASKASSARLKDAAARAKAAGYDVKVAVIQSGIDLGAIPQAFNKPQQYASFLARELVQLYGPKARVGLLVVMPDGFGIAGRNFSDAERAAVKKVQVSSGANSEQLVTAATAALQDMAAAAGHPIGKSTGGGKHGSSGTLIAVVFGGLLLLAAGLGLALRLRGGRDTR